MSDRRIFFRGSSAYLTRHSSGAFNLKRGQTRRQPAKTERQLSAPKLMMTTEHAVAEFRSRANTTIKIGRATIDRARCPRKARLPRIGARIRCHPDLGRSYAREPPPSLGEGEGEGEGGRISRIKVTGGGGILVPSFANNQKLKGRLEVEK